MTALLLHGGAGKIKSVEDEQSHRTGITRARDEGWKVLAGGGSAVDAVERAVMTMEDNPVFNCGYGSVLDFYGHVQMDAAIMTGRLDAGGVVNATGLRHPIHAARLVMEKTDHVLLGEPGLGEFLDMMGLPHDEDLRAPNRVAEWTSMRESFSRNDFLDFDRNVEFFKRAGNLKGAEYYSTVGAVALDGEGLVAAATSTGGIRMKLFGRIGDTPLMGCGTYADEYGAASATGIGEQIIKLTLCRMAVLYMRELPADRAVEKAVGEARAKGYECGLIGVDRSGGLGFGYTTPTMSWASATGDGRTANF